MSKSDRFRRIMIVVAVVIAVLAFAGSVMLMGSSPGPGEVSVILHGGFIVLGLITAGVFAAIAAWLALWRIRWPRYLGILALVVGVLWLTVWPPINNSIQMSRYAEMEARETLRSEAYWAHVAQLGTMVQDADAARGLHDAYLERLREIDSSYAEEIDGFGYIHYIFMAVFFEEAEPVQQGLRGARFWPPPFGGTYFCYTFYESYDDLLTTPALNARAEALCDRIQY